MAIDKAAFKKFIDSFPGELICARQVWYEGLSGHGTANSETVKEIEDSLDGADGWENVGDVRYEKYGLQNSWKLRK